MNRKEISHWMYRHPFFIIVAVFTVIDITLFFALIFSTPRTLQVTFFDVGQGDAVLIEAPNGNQLLYDAGPPSGALVRQLSRVLPFWDHSIDVAVFSHPDMDHIGGFPDVFKRYDIGAVLESGAHSENGVYDKTEQSIIDENSAHIIARKGMSIILGDGVVADVLYPDQDTTHMETNSASIVLRVRYGTTAFLLSGDLPQKQEEYVAREFGDGLHSQVLKLGHHGSRTSSSPYWMSAVSPDVAVISAGKDNRYGHPHKEVLELLTKMKIPYLETFQEGDIMFASDGEVVTRI